MTRTGDFVEDPNKRRRIRTLRRVRLKIVREIIETNIDMEGDDIAREIIDTNIYMEGDDTKYTLKCIWNKH